MLWYILLYASIHECSGVRMPLTRKNLRGIFSNGDIILGGIFPIHITALEDHPLFRGHPRVFVCKIDGLSEYRLKPIQLQWAMTMVFAIDEINKDDSLLPNITLGYFIFDSCFSITKLMEYVLTEIRKNIETSDINEESYSPAIVGPFNSEFSKNLNNILSLFSVPQISYAASCKCLGNKKQFPSFLRTYPNNIFRIPAVIGLVKHFDWMYVGIMNVDDEFGKTFAADFGTEAEKENICLAFHLDWPQVYEERHLVKLGECKIIQASNHFIKFTFLLKWIHFFTLQYFVSNPVRNKIVQLAVNRLIVIYSSEITNHFSSHYLPNLMQLHGSIEQSQSIFINEFWEKTFECTLTTKAKEIQPCMGNESLKEVTTPFTEVSQLFLPFNIYKAVYAIAHALHDMTTCIMGNGPFENGSCTDIHNLWPWQLLFYIRNVNFVLKMREEIFQFDDNGDPPAIYDLVNWQTDDNGEMHLERVGSFDATARARALDSQIHFSLVFQVPRSVCSEPCQPGTRKVSLKGEPFCCFDCIPCTDGHYSNTTDSQECQNCPEDLWSNKQRSTCLPMPREFLSFSDPLALTLLAFSALGCAMAVIVWIMIFKYHELIVSQSARSVLHFILLTSLASSCVSNVMFVGEPTDLSCQWRESLAVYLIAFSIIAVLTRVKIQFLSFFISVPQTWALATEYYQPKVLMVLCSLPQTGFCVAWAVLGKLQRHKNIESRLGTIVLECIGASPLWVSCALFYLGTLAISCLVMALKGRKLAPDCNEHKFIIFSMLFFFMVLIAFIPAYSSTQGKFAVATEMFAIMAICYGFLGCIFLPKCYLIALKMKK
uniref:G-protein coupled receptors family 3 profile domain-containing protein n=1 Tax=Eptatretus burgeri TaxID=7764 RepID=A0A8C4R0C6_EPTBU